MDQKNTVSVSKILSTNSRYREGLLPQWNTESHINYISEFDFASYDLDDDKLDLIQRPHTHSIIYLKFTKMIGQNMGRILYIYKEDDGFYLMAIPCFRERNKNMRKKITHPQLTIAEIKNFQYIIDYQAVIIPVRFSNDQWGLIYENLADQRSIKMERNFPRNTQPQTFLKYVKILICRKSNLLILIYPRKMQFIKISQFSTHIEILSRYSYSGIIQDPIYLNLSKIYIIGRERSLLKCFILDHDKVEKQLFFDSGVEEEIGGMVGSYNKIIIWLKNQPLIYQFGLNDIKEKIQIISKADLSSEKISKIEAIVVSESARQVMVVQTQQSDVEQKKNDLAISNILIFKIQLYSQLKINDFSLYLRALKYTSRTKRVNKICLPKIYEQVYAITGSEVHTLDNHMLMGVHNFDIHPFGLFIAVAYSFNVKICSVQHGSMTLLYNMSMQNVKKMLYSPDGAYLILQSPRRIKIIDAFSFQLKYQHHQKNVSIMNFCISPNNRNFYILLDSSVIIEKNFLDFEQSSCYRVYYPSLKKIIQFQIQEDTNMLYFRVDGGSIVAKSTDGGRVQESLVYSDREKITALLVDKKNGLIVMGTNSGKIRIHESNLFRINQFIEKQINLTEITSLAISTIKNYLYVGNAEGNITVLKISSDNNITMSINASKLLLNSMFTKNDFATQGFSFQLLNSAKFNGNSEMNCLQDKLENLVEKIQSHTTIHRIQMLQNFRKEEKNLLEGQQFNKKQFYLSCETKLIKLQNQLLILKQKNKKVKADEDENYQKNIKVLFEEGVKLEKIKSQIIEKNKAQIQEQAKIIQLQTDILVKQLNSKYNHSQRFFNGEKIGKQQFQNDQWEEDQNFGFCQREGMIYLKKGLQKQFNSLKNKCLELKKNTGYLETAKKNMLSRKVQEETLEYRIKNQLDSLGVIKLQQQQKICKMGNDLKSTEEIIHKIQNKVKSGPNLAISSDKSDNDLCSYKIWMNEKGREEVQRMSQFLKSLELTFDRKSQDLITILNERKQYNQKESILNKKKDELKAKLKLLTDQIVTMKSHKKQRSKQFSMTQRPFKEKQEENLNDSDGRIRKLISMERIHQKNIHFENKNVKIHSRKVRKLNGQSSQLLNQFKKLKFQNKIYLDKQKKLKSDIEKEEVTSQKKRIKLFSSSNSILSNKETPFVSYIRSKSKKLKQNNVSHIITATSSPKATHWRSARSSVKITM